MDRREMLVGGVGLSLLAVSGQALAQGKAQPAKGAPAKGGAAKPAMDPRDALLAALSDCISKAQLCAGHCVEELANGNLQMAKCSASVNELLAVTSATQALVGRKSALAKKAAALCAEACAACAAACAEHKEHFAHGMHLACKACMEACQVCEKVCKAFAA
jgi:Cys-rich four helix bundle protein (predicted Tat secretion target)